MKHFLTLFDREQEELKELINTAIAMKKKRAQSINPYNALAGKSVALIFEKASTRTRVSFEVGVVELGGNPIFLSKDDIQLGRGESIKHTARVLSRYAYGIVMRTAAHARLEELAEYASIPVINGLTDDFHPCQVLADVMTFYERLGHFNKVKVAYIGDGNNMANSWANAAAQFGFHLIIASPKECAPKPDIIEYASQRAKHTGGSIEVTENMYHAASAADVISTDVWTSMGQEKDEERKRKLLENFQIDDVVMNRAGKQAIFMHCLPAHLGEEVTEKVFESSASVVFDEAENRLHIQKALMAKIIGELG